MHAIDFLPSVSGLGSSYHALYEMAALLVRGTPFVRNELRPYSIRPTEHLSDLLDPQYFNTISDKGYAFLAHPADGDTGTGITRLGPDLDRSIRRSPESTGDGDMFFGYHRQG